MRNLIILLGGFALIGCGGNLCQKLADDAEACGVESSDADMEACEEQLSSCNADDEKLLIDFFDCMDEAGMGMCDEETTTATSMEDFEAQMAAMAACATDAAAISAECQASFGVGGTTGGT